MLDKAIAECQKALAINPDFEFAHYSLSVAHFFKGNYALATAHYDKAVELGYGGNPEFMELLKPYR